MRAEALLNLLGRKSLKFEAKDKEGFLLIDRGGLPSVSLLTVQTAVRKL
jgi:hypothetical protein